MPPLARAQICLIADFSPEVRVYILYPPRKQDQSIDWISVTLVLRQQRMSIKWVAGSLIQSAACLCHLCCLQPLGFISAYTRSAGAALYLFIYS